MDNERKMVSIDVSNRQRMAKDTEKFFNQAIEFAANGDFNEAINALHEVTKANPKHTKAWAVKAMLYRLVGNPLMAELCTKTVDKQYPE